MKPELIRFSSHPNAFRLKTVHCMNLDCECTEVTFQFDEIMENGEPASKRMDFELRLDGLKWEEDAPKQRSPEVARIVEEFLRDYPASERQALQEACQEKSRIARRLREFRIEPRWIEEGALVSFGEIIYDRSSGTANSSSFLCSFEHEGKTYLVDDMYCPNPKCECNEVHLYFLRYSPHGRNKKAVSERLFLAKLSFDGHAQVENCDRGTQKEAKAILSAWRELFDDDVEELQWRYHKVKEIAQRSVPHQITSSGRITISTRENPLPEESTSSTVRTGRNEPCPCGSGKKFKKCCAKKNLA